MTDITKCRGDGCPFQEICFRYIADTDPYWQSFFAEVPINITTNDCEYFWDIFDVRDTVEDNK